MPSSGLRYPENGSKRNQRRGQRGAALAVVLSALAVLTVVVTLIWDRLRPDIRAWGAEAAQMQALYLAESGIAFQLYLEKFADSAEASFGPAKTLDTLLAFPDTSSNPKDTFGFQLDRALGAPEVKVDRTRAFLDMTATGRFRAAEVKLFARFGKALDDSIFGPALTLENSETLDPFPYDQVRGTVRLRTPSEQVPSQPWPAGLSLSAYTAEFIDKKYHASEALLLKQLAREGGESGNGGFDPDHPPDFAGKKDIFFPLGGVEIRNDREETWVIRGPGRIFAEGEIRIRGRVRLEKIQLFSARDITFSDSISGEEIAIYARGNAYFQDRCRLELEAVAGKDIVLRDQCQTDAGSVLVSVGNPKAAKAGDTLNAIRVVNQAVARGFLIAGGANGRVALATQANRVEGIVMARHVWLAGSVYGAVLAQKLLCEGTNIRNCLGPGRIDRGRLPRGFVQPLQLGPQDRRTYEFQLVSWRRM